MLASSFKRFMPFMACLSLISASANYSVQLMEDLAPSDWSAEEWAAAADTVIGKTQAHIISDLIEDLGIKLQVTEESIRQRIDEERGALGLKPLPPHEDKPGPFHYLKKKEDSSEEDQDYSSYLPPGWTEEKYKTYSDQEARELPDDVRDKLFKRQSQELNPGYFAGLPKKVLNNITSTLHEYARQQLGVPEGVRAYKREIAPLVQVFSLQNHENFGFILCMPSHVDEEALHEFVETLDMINAAQLQNFMEGTGLENIEGRFMMPLDAEIGKNAKDISAEDCRQRYRLVRKEGGLPSGLDTGIVLMADKEAIQSLTEFSMDNPAHVWAVDLDFDPEKNTYPEGYDGTFKVRCHALLHHLYVAVGSGLMTPVEVWGLLQRRNVPIVDAEMIHHNEL